MKHDTTRESPEGCCEFVWNGIGSDIGTDGEPKVVRVH